jgi:radical SAM superfamily enzyme YgiQ (UPF0313 family)
MKITWQTPNGISALTTNKKILEKMKKSGCIEIMLAPESGCERVLRDIIHKPQKLSKVVEIIVNALQIGIKTGVFLVIGLPGETLSDIKQTFSFSKALGKLGIDEIVVSTFFPIPGSDLYEQLLFEKKLPEKQNIQDYIAIGDYQKAKSFSSNFKSNELKSWRQRIYFFFYVYLTLYHPFKTFKLIMNVLRGKEEIKTERFLIVLIRRLFKKSNYSKKFVIH